MTIKYNSVTHDVLVYAKMIKRPFRAPEPMVVFARMDRLSKVNRSINMLIKEGLLKDCGDENYEITKSGIDRVYFLARNHKSEVHSFD